MKTSADYLAEAAQFAPLREIFWDKVCQAGLWDRIDEVSQRGMKAIFGDVSMLSYVIAGRTLVTISRGDEFISFIAADRDRRNIGLQELYGEPVDLMQMVITVIKAWPKEADEQRAIFKVDATVQIGL